MESRALVAAPGAPRLLLALLHAGAPAGELPPAPVAPNAGTTGTSSTPPQAVVQFPGSSGVRGAGAEVLAGTPAPKRKTTSLPAPRSPPPNSPAPAGGPLP